MQPYPFFHLEPVLTEFIRPSSDVETSSWTTTPLWSKLDDNSDADFVRSTDSAAVCSSTDTYNFEVALADPTGPPSGRLFQGMRFRYRVRKVQTDTGTVSVTVRLKELTTTRVTSSVGSIGTSWTTYTKTLTASEIETIGNHNDLRMQVEVVVCNDLDFNTIRGECAWLEVEYYAL